jgi:hypothetical protein
MMTAKEILEKRMKELERTDMNVQEHEHICWLLYTDFYEQASKFAKETGFKKVVDIGSAFGSQKVYFDEQGIEYMGIDQDFESEYVAKGYYPDDIEFKYGDDDTLAISHLCLTWNIYTGNDDETVIKQIKGLKRDFKYILIQAQHDKVWIIEQEFDNIEKLDSEHLAELLFITNKG